ncbi:uncharacterized protein MONOS_11541 [Monocercomonoides exilis]|uniref:uncharacterized protein n=1 Tax=Monocercomonoides exilis TaxID=2049356 RepID=UPI0035599664|nr:hypothetical protein MONOS_11541 [Monocercomonoides exilis]|eukprot:MONOS_11541.1-p1 / transcript=MONOS_11541.1 / gene=MONOS_11541 / organism=Monocercomonoides_exilis_PA203 / gene_product=unspecified product / transcript_product=unspecified product / location=Mono_scaffold00584:37084-37338(+) / protein_length=85 / sequence_SO=supercontig / SO=protein_coding / is_pseudo=false
MISISLYPSQRGNRDQSSTSGVSFQSVCGSDDGLCNQTEYRHLGNELHRVLDTNKEDSISMESKQRDSETDSGDKVSAAEQAEE